ncbi:hypothetical protein EON79_21630 [bacterium]|nr:MAG: hypothetical protein EON79_21630 [bacterium]
MAAIARTFRRIEVREATQLVDAFTKLFADVWGAKVLAAVFGAIVGYLFPEESMRVAALATFGMIVLDMITGIAASAVSGHAISSAKFSRTLTKMLAFGSLIIVAAVVPKHVIGAGIAAGISVNLVLSVILLNESISIAENAEKMGYGFPWMRKWLKERVRITAASVSSDAQEEPKS